MSHQKTAFTRSHLFQFLEYGLLHRLFMLSMSHNGAWIQIPHLWIKATDSLSKLVHQPIFVNWRNWNYFCFSGLTQSNLMKIWFCLRIMQELSFNEYKYFASNTMAHNSSFYGNPLPLYIALVVCACLNLHFVRWHDCLHLKSIRFALLTAFLRDDLLVDNHHGQKLRPVIWADPMHSVRFKHKTKMSVKSIQSSVCYLCGVENAVPTCFVQQMAEAVEILFEFAYQGDQKVEKVRIEWMIESKTCHENQKYSDKMN